VKVIDVAQWEIFDLLLDLVSPFSKQLTRVQLKVLLFAVTDHL